MSQLPVDIANISILPLDSSHWSSIDEIYRESIQQGISTFESSSPESWETFNNKFLPHSRFIAVKNSLICGWASLSPVSSRACYRGVSEVSIYVSNQYRNQGIGHLLLEQLIISSEKN